MADAKSLFDWINGGGELAAGIKSPHLDELAFGEPKVVQELRQEVAHCRDELARKDLLLTAAESELKTMEQRNAANLTKVRASIAGVVNARLQATFAESEELKEKAQVLKLQLETAHGELKVARDHVHDAKIREHDLKAALDRHIRNSIEYIILKQTMKMYKSGLYELKATPEDRRKVLIKSIKDDLTGITCIVQWLRQRGKSLALADQLSAMMEVVTQPDEIAAGWFEYFETERRHSGP
jgi:DNA repair exonuclease SbcCD ATPase subunit